MNLHYYLLVLITTKKKGNGASRPNLFVKNNANKKQEKYCIVENTSSSFLSIRQLQTFPSLTQKFSSKSDLQSAVDEYCQDPEGWVNNKNYTTYG